MVSASFYVLLFFVGDLTASNLNQNGSFIVSANYGVQSSVTPSSWKVVNSPEVIYGNPTKNWTLPQDRNDNFDMHKPSVTDLQQMISKILKGATKVHQVVKVPAVYEIHLQEEEKHSRNTLQTPLKQRTTKTWNLPSKIQYFDKSSKYGKYPYPRPFTMKWTKPIPLDTWKLPGSTTASFLDYKHPGVDLSLYYAKKKELENQNIGKFHRRSSKGERRRVRQERLFPGFSPGINYVIHVREKSY